MMNKIVKQLIAFLALVTFGALPLAQHIGFRDALVASFLMISFVLSSYFVWNYLEIRKLKLGFHYNVILPEQVIPLSYLNLRVNQISELGDRLKKKSIEYKIDDDGIITLTGPYFFRYKLQIVSDSESLALKCTPASHFIIFGGHNSLKIVSYLL